VYGLVFSILAGLVWHYSRDWQMTASIVGVGLLVLSLLALLVLALLRGIGRLLPHLNLTARFALQGLLRNRQTSLSQILAFSITLAAMVLSFSVRTDLIDNWQQQLPSNAANHFALNIFADKLNAFQADLQQAQIPSSPFYPVVRGRLVAINDEAVQKRVSKDSKGEAAN